MLESVHINAIDTVRPRRAGAGRLVTAFTLALPTAMSGVAAATGVNGNRRPHLE